MSWTTSHALPRDAEVSVFAVRNRIGYRLVTHEARGGAPAHSVLQAVDLTRDDGRSVDLLTLPPEPEDHRSHSYDPPRIPHLTSKDGVAFWDGKEWRSVSWLKEMPPGR